MTILSRIIIEIVGSPKEHASKVLETVLDKLRGEKGVKVMKENVGEPQELKELKGFWSTFADLEIEIEELEKLLDICFDYMPSSIEIIEPQSLNVDMRHMTNLVNDMLTRLHDYNMVIKNIHAENILLKKRLDSLEDKNLYKGEKTDEKNGA